MGNYFCSYADNLRIARILDAEHQIYVGISKALSPVQLQVVRIGNETQPCYRLRKCTETENKLTYHFEQNIVLVLERHEHAHEHAREHAIRMELFDPKRDLLVSKPVDSIAIKYFKPISFEHTSEDLDKIYDLFHGTPTKT